jgi:MFS family permease
MFLMYAPLGASWPQFSLHLKALGFTPLQMAWVCATPALGMLAAPLLAGQVADRWFPANRLLVCYAFLAGCLLWILPELRSPQAVFGVSLALWLFLTPAVTLGTVVSFSHLPSPEHHFGRIRLWGTVGWVVPGWLLGLWFRDPARGLSDIFRLAGLFTFALGAYALTLPHTPPQRRSGTWLAPLGALRLVRDRAFAVFLVCALGVYVTLPFTSQVTPLLLRELGVSQSWMGPTLTIAQSTEIISLALLSMLLLRFGLRGTMLLGLGAWMLALGVLTLGSPLGLVVSSQALNGLCICCFLVAGQVFINRKARGDIRASVQALLSFTAGLGMLLGNLLVGATRALVHEAFTPTFAVAAVITVVLVVVFFAGFRDDETE